MANKAELHLGSDANPSNALHYPEWAIAALLGLAAGVFAALFVTAHWTLAVVGLIALVALSAVEYEPFLLAMVFLLPVSWAEPEGIFHDVLTAIRLLVIIGFFAGRFWRGNLNWRQLWAPRLSRTSVLFLAIAVASVTFGPAGWKHDSVAQGYRLVSWVGFYLLALAWINSSRRLVKVLVTLLASICLLGSFSLIQEAVGGYTRLWLYLNPPGPDFGLWSGRAPSLVFYPTALAGYLDVALPFAVAAWIAGRGLVKKLGGWAIGLGTIALVFSQSLGGLLAFGVVLALAIRFFVRSRRRRFWSFAGLLALAGCFFLLRHALNPAHFANPTRTLPPDVIIRLLQFHAAWTLLLQHPILGVGFGNFGAMSGAVLPDASWMPSSSLMASNLYLNLLAETGLLGFAAFFYLLFIIFRDAWGEMKRTGWTQCQVFAFGALGAVSAVLVHGTVDYLFLASQCGTILWLVPALLVASSRVRSPQAVNGGRAGRAPQGGLSQWASSNDNAALD